MIVYNVCDSDIYESHDCIPWGSGRSFEEWLLN